MPNVLMVAYYFPPMGGAGVQRTLKFVKYLPEHGWIPHVLTVREKTRLVDERLLREVPGGVHITRTGMLGLPSWLPWRLRSFIARWLFIVDEQVGWLPDATEAGRKVLEGGEIKVIYSTSTPYTSHLVARRLHKETKLPWVADLRDPWMRNPFIKFPTALHRWIHVRLEESVFTEADRVVLNTEASRLHHLQKYPGLPETKFITIPNGYDQDDIDVVDKVPQKPSVFTMAHLGSLYQKARSSKHLLAGICEVLQGGKVPADHFVLRFVGNVDKRTQALVSQYGLGKNVEFLGYIPHQQALSQLFGADLLILLPYYGKGADLSIPAKVYEYLASEKPILCLAEAGPCAELIQQARAGSVVPPGDTKAIAGELERLYRLWEAGSLHVEPDLQLVASFERRKLAARLASAFNGVSA